VDGGGIVITNRIVTSALTLSFLALASLAACTLESGGSNSPRFGLPGPDSVENGGVDGGGGKAVVCRGGDGKITHAETLDLYEARTMYGYTPQVLSTPMEKQARAALQRVPATSRAVLAYYVDLVLKNMKVLSTGAGLLPIDDSLESIFPKGCAAEQLANYRADQSILVDGEIWDALNETERAALVLHEALYALNRLVKATDSRQTRHAVGRLFDPAQVWEDVAEGVPADALYCRSRSTGLFFRAFKKGPYWTLQFQLLGRSFQLTKTLVKITQPDFDFNEVKRQIVETGENRIGSSVLTAAFSESLFEGGDSLELTRRWEPLVDSNNQILAGYQTLRYYLKWNSRSHTKLSAPEKQIDCSMEVGE
jgi:hypothetical protein